MLSYSILLLSHTHHIRITHSLTQTIQSLIYTSHTHHTLINPNHTMALKKLPPEVARELLRHIKPAANASTTGKQQHVKPKNSSTGILVACIGLVSFAGAIPYIATQWIGNLSDRDESLTPAQVRRGAFLNSGSRDAGKDPNWDWKNGTYIYPPGFAEHLKMQRPTETDFGPNVGPMTTSKPPNSKA
jgi:hypothetical protein